jgi:soluble lytic murein transglycosylase
MLTLSSLKSCFKTSIWQATAFAWVATLSTALSAADLAQAPHVNENTIEQRSIFTLARAAFAAGDAVAFHELRAQLSDYPLVAYLDYPALIAQLPSLPYEQVDNFLNTWSGTYLAERLEREWLTELARQELWGDIQRYHNPENSTTVLSCHALRARLEAGDRSALSDVSPLWNVGRSQPNECDPLFESWLAEGFLTPDIAWDRFRKLLQARQHNLANYIARLMPSREQALAELYLSIDNDPTRLPGNEGLRIIGPETREITLHGIRRLALTDAPLALQTLAEYRDIHTLDESETLALQRDITLRLLLQGFVSEAENLLHDTPGLATETLVGTVLREAMRYQDWPRIAAWLNRLPADAQESERWQYWRARTLELEGTSESLIQARVIHAKLAQTRSFYGFLSSDKLGLNYEFVERPVQVSTAEMLALYDQPAIVRAYELFHIDDEINARNEWQHATRGMTQQQVISSGKLANSWGWYRNSIQAMIQASHWDDLQLRFPLAYHDLFTAAASEYQIQTPFLFAVARQESAFMQDVSSPAGARGLMQLMPGTARQTAGRIGLQISEQDLFNPDINIALGSRYMAELLAEFNGNRILATAAYNAGPNRVKQWLERSAANPLPLDMWIETIPFFETRAYVQNVLAYSVIYGYRMGTATSFLTEEEQTSML